MLDAPRVKSLKTWLKARLSKKWRRHLKEAVAVLYRNDLPSLATLYGTDKWGSHWYAAHYARHFSAWRRKKAILLEIGVGGYEDPQAGGESLRMWRRYFPDATVVGLDYFDKSPHSEKRIKIYRGDQSDEMLLRRIVSEVGRPDIIIDDGSHQNAHVIKSFEVLFPLLADDGIYAIEDTQTAYWAALGGLAETDPTNLSTSMNFLKSLVDGLNHEEFRRPGYRPTYYDRNITSISFYHNLVFVQKGLNDEGTNAPE